MSEHQAITSGVAGRYALALFELAEEAGSLDEVRADLNGLGSALKTSDDLKRLVANPVFSREDQGRAMAAVLDKAGANALTKNFIALVARKRRLGMLKDMIKAYDTLLADKRGEVTAEVTSAHKLKAEQIKKLKAALKASLGREVQVETSIDQSLLGGLIVKVGSRMIDSSLRTKLSKLKIAMKEAR